MGEVLFWKWISNSMLLFRRSSWCWIPWCASTEQTWPHLPFQSVSPCPEGQSARFQPRQPWLLGLKGLIGFVSCFDIRISDFNVASKRMKYSTISNCHFSPHNLWNRALDIWLGIPMQNLSYWYEIICHNSSVTSTGYSPNKLKFLGIGITDTFWYDYCLYLQKKREIKHEICLRKGIRFYNFPPQNKRVTNT